jgi:hypothetical protein
MAIREMDLQLTPRLLNAKFNFFVIVPRYHSQTEDAHVGVTGGYFNHSTLNY